jgi:import receptor subunit TOM20
MSEIAKGEQLLALGDVETGIEHLANAVAVTSHKENLLNVLRTTLPDPIFRLLVEKLPEVSQKIYNSYKAKAPGGVSASTGRNTADPFSSEAKIVEITEENLAIDDCLD